MARRKIINAPLRRGLPTGNPPSMESEGVRFPVLISYAYLRDLPEEQKQYFLKDAKKDGFDIFLDSGAFSAANAGKEILLDEYIKFLHQYEKSFFGYVMLDKLGCPETSQRNLDTMYSEGLSPVPVHVLGDNAKRMDELFERAHWVCCGGFRLPGKGHNSKEYVVEKMRWAKGRHVHWLGYTNKVMTRALTPYSVDSSNITASDRYGMTDIYLGSGKMFGFHRTKRRQNFPLKVQRAIQRFGYEVKDIQVNSAWGRSGDENTYDPPARMLHYLSHVYYTLDVRQKFGTRVFTAIGDKKSLDLVKVGFDRWKAEQEKKGRS